MFRNITEPRCGFGCAGHSQEAWIPSLSLLSKLPQPSPPFPSDAPAKRRSPRENAEEMAITWLCVCLLELKEPRTTEELASTTDGCFASLEAVVLGTKWWQMWLLLWESLVHTLAYKWPLPPCVPPYPLLYVCLSMQIFSLSQDR